MARVSAGLLLYRRQADGRLQVFLAHPGGPYFRNKDQGHWTIPKGEFDGDEDPLAAARREFAEETGIEPGRKTGSEADSDPRSGAGGEAGDRFIDLGTIQQKGGKVVHAWAIEGDGVAAEPVCRSTFEIEWPPRSGRMQEFPEIDRMGFFDLPEARAKINPAQEKLIDRLLDHLETTGHVERASP